MAEETDSGSKTEDASPRKLQEARDRGEVPKSNDVVTFASLTAVSAVLLFAGGGLAHGMVDRLRPFISRPDDFDMANGGGIGVLRLAAGAAAPSLMSVLGGAVLAGVAANLIQTGFMLTTGPLTPNLDRLSLLQGFK